MICIFIPDTNLYSMTYNLSLDTSKWGFWTMFLTKSVGHTTPLLQKRKWSRCLTMSSSKTTSRCHNSKKRRGPESQVIYIHTPCPQKNSSVCILAITSSNLNQIQKVRSVLNSAWLQLFKTVLTFDIMPSKSWENWA